MNVRLVGLTLPIFEALAAGNVDRAADLLGLDIPSAFIERIEVWQFFIRLLADHPEAAGWTMNDVVDGELIIGNAGFKGAPDGHGMVEIGYTIQPNHRRSGYAAAAVDLLLERAAAEPRVRIVRAVVNSGNTASIAVLTRARFTREDDVMHPRDGRQLLFTHPPRS